MIDLKFELNDITGKYDARSHHTEIYISDDTKMDEETVRLYKYILDELIQHSIGGLSHLIFYNGKNSDEKTLKEVRDFIESIFRKESTRIHYWGIDKLTDFPEFVFRVKDLTEEEMSFLNIDRNTIELRINISYSFEGPISMKNSKVICANFFVYYKTQYNNREYEAHIKVGESHFDRETMITLPINGRE